MIVYHGSNHNFSTLRIRKDLTKESSKVNEGYGIYFSTDKEVAKSYGKYLYTIEINNKYVVNLRNTKTCMKLVNNLAKYIYDNTHIDIRGYLDLSNVAQRVYYGDQSIAYLNKEIVDILDSNYIWYQDGYEDKLEIIDKLITKYLKNTIKVYMFNYNIANSGIIKDVSNTVCRIIAKDKINQ